jgi:hypothetical protein
MVKLLALHVLMHLHGSSGLWTRGALLSGSKQCVNLASRLYRSKTILAWLVQHSSHLDVLSKGRLLHLLLCQQLCGLEALQVRKAAARSHKGPCGPCRVNCLILMVSLLYYTMPPCGQPKG